MLKQHHNSPQQGSNFLTSSISMHYVHGDPCRSWEDQDDFQEGLLLLDRALFKRPHSFGTIGPILGEWPQSSFLCSYCRNALAQGLLPMITSPVEIHVICWAGILLQLICRKSDAPYTSHLSCDTAKVPLQYRSLRYPLLANNNPELWQFPYSTPDKMKTVIPSS